MIFSNRQATGFCKVATQTNCQAFERGMKKMEDFIRDIIAFYSKEENVKAFEEWRKNHEEGGEKK